MSEQVIDQVGEYYDDIGELVELVGGNLHVGYWESDEDDTPFLAAMQRLTTEVGALLAPRKGERVLDIGCGVGEPAVRLAQRYAITITGITVSHWQVAESARRVIAAGLRGRVATRYADAGAQPFPDAVFDAALAFDSLPSAQDKARWLREVHRVLRPGGRFVFTEYPRTAELTAAERDILTANTIHHPPATLDESIALAEAAGFRVTGAHDWSERVHRTYDEFFTALAEQTPALAEEYGAERVAMFTEGITTMFSLCRAKIGYHAIACEKPA
ncbi:methyltransferase domain-containing protein [Actinokineospora globicatena]|uniref:methyltransferase domain-containing protein n=1 Tax=Actinokineospora globicatena TaxID=103729 RepID=UPI0020A2AABD|nr:methyltransferase domain-containing protein [Actinokineospora globicatena]MCP2303632.1 27-O-demethylrifamycin SV methyltransferase [Actinokineospora globicatena]GLW79231.1 methyltransferase type 11 [Actinokineospora globicatena]GLW86359.1 methyltransferase type 11 [Actinokineospora globicatena]